MVNNLYVSKNLLLSDFPFVLTTTHCVEGFLTQKLCTHSLCLSEGVSAILPGKTLRKLASPPGKCPSMLISRLLEKVWCNLTRMGPRQILIQIPHLALRGQVSWDELLHFLEV